MRIDPLAIFFRASILFGLFAASGCYQTQIDGAFDGLYTLTKPEVELPARLFIVNGMTCHEDGYADTLVDGLRSRLGLTDPEAAAGHHDQPYAVSGAIAFKSEGAASDTLCPQNGIGGAIANEDPYVNIRTYHLYRGAQEEVRVSAVNWSRLTESIKQHQFKEDDSISRAVLNGDIKVGVVNDGIGDAALYLGKYKSVMQRGVIIALCAFLDGDYQGGSCTSTSHASKAPVALISESLGSYMLADAIRTMSQKTKSPAGTALSGRLREFYMFANQVPLLELATLRPAGPRPTSSVAPPSEKDRFAAFVQKIVVDHNRIAPNVPLHVVAFTDPNDLLSYPIGPDNLTRLSPKPSNDPPSNVYVPVARDYFGLFANPLQAHTGYSSDPEVLRLVTCGTTGCSQ